MNRYFSSMTNLGNSYDEYVIWDVTEQRMVCATIRPDDANRIAEALNLHDRVFTHPTAKAPGEKE